MGQKPLTQRQVEIAVLLTKGGTDKEIAEVLGVSASTVIDHVKRMRTKFEARSRAHLAAMLVLWLHTPRNGGIARWRHSIECLR